MTEAAGGFSGPAMQALTPTDILLLPLILSFFGVLVYILGWNARKDGVLPAYRWAGILLLGLALFVGMRYVWDLHNPALGAFRRAELAMDGRRVLYSHYLAAAIPAFFLLLCSVLEFVARRTKPGKPAEPTVTEA
jgi:phosphoglycerol transferase MdoB-like AlkP superfamily enzyme